MESSLQGRILNARVRCLRGEEAFLSQVVLMFFPLPLDKSVHSRTPDRKARLRCYINVYLRKSSWTYPAKKGVKAIEGHIVMR